MEKKRCVKMDEITKNMLIYALRDMFREEKAKEVSCKETGKLILKLADHNEKTLFLSEDEYQKVILALNNLRDTYMNNGRYTDGIDIILCKVMKAKYKKVGK